MACFQGFSEGGHLTIGGVGQHYRGLSESPLQRLVDQA
jgi:hypothetical protein